MTGILRRANRGGCGHCATTTSRGRTKGIRTFGRFLHGSVLWGVRRTFTAAVAGGGSMFNRRQIALRHAAGSTGPSTSRRRRRLLRTSRHAIVTDAFDLSVGRCSVWNRSVTSRQRTSLFLRCRGTGCSGAQTPQEDQPSWLFLSCGLWVTKTQRTTVRSDFVFRGPVGMSTYVQLVLQLLATYYNKNCTY